MLGYDSPPLNNPDWYREVGQRPGFRFPGPSARSTTAPGYSNSAVSTIFYNMSIRASEYSGIQFTWLYNRLSGKVSGRYRLPSFVQVFIQS